VRYDTSMEMANTHSDAFTQAYAKLNPEQKQAVDAIEGPVMVIAGPGTGKTQILTLRIANILRLTDTQPEQILALTFTDSGARAMRNRLRQYIGAMAYRVPVYTFHGFANHLITAYPEAYERIVGGRPVTDLEQVRIIEDILMSDSIALLRPTGRPDMYIKAISRAIQDCKKEYIAPADLAKRLQVEEERLLEIPQYHEKGAHKGKERTEYTKAVKQLTKNKEYLYVYRQYEAILQHDHLFDFEDMIRDTVQTLENNNELLQFVQEQYQYVLADEHQDVNGAQNRILELLTNFHQQPNIFVVGDEKQAIYRFQGASLQNFLHFQDVYCDTVVISLSKNYRSGQAVLDTAQTLVAVASDSPLAPLRLPLQSQVEAPSTVTITEFAHEESEVHAVVEAIKKEIDGGASADDIAIILRSNREVERYAVALRKVGCEVVASADTDIFGHPVLQAVIGLLQAVTNPSEETLASVLHGAYWSVSLADVAAVMRARSYGQPLISILSSPEVLKTSSVTDVEAVLHIMSVLETARARAVTESPLRVMEYVIQESGLLRHVTVHDPVFGLSVLRRVYDEVSTLVVANDNATLQSIVADFQMRRDHNLALSVPYSNSTSGGVQVMTAHKSKGLEFATVMLPNVTEQVWSGTGGRQLLRLPIYADISEDIADDIAQSDETRLLYVAMTRAKEKLYLSYSTQSVAGKEQLPSPLLELCRGVVTIEPAPGMTESNNISRFAMVPPAIPLVHEITLQTLIDRGISATGFNNYLEDPWQYFFRNVLRVPEAQALPMMFGTVAHSVLEKTLGEYQSSGQLPSDATLMEYIALPLRKLPLSSHEYTTLHARAVESLLPYIHERKKTWPLRSEREYKVTVLLPTGMPELPELPLTGVFDRLDYGENGKVVAVVDYKTGKPKSRNVIEGKTKDSNGNYKRQLVFYALLLELLGDDRRQTKTGIISFVEPSTRHTYKDEVFIVTDDEVQELKQQLIIMVQNVLEGTAYSLTSTVSDYQVFIDRWLGGVS